MSDIELQIILPACSDDPLSDMLRLITEAIEEHNGEVEGYGLGGMHGYGSAWDSPVFTMRRFCWGDCDCGFEERSETWHKANPHASNCFRSILQQRFAEYDQSSGWNAIDEESRSEKYFSRGVDETPFGTMHYSTRNAAGEVMHKKWSRAYDAMNEAHRRMTDELYDEFALPRAPYQWHCTCGVGDAAEAYFEVEGHYPACALELPNFRHHASGFEVRWYKYIGRDNETINQPADLTPVFRDCLADIAASGMEAGTGETEGLDPKDDSPVGGAETPNPPAPPPTGEL